MDQVCQEKGQTVTNEIRSWRRQVNQSEHKTNLDKGDSSQKVRPRAREQADDKDTDDEQINGSDNDAKRDRQPEVLPDEVRDGLLWARSGVEDKNGAAVLASSGNLLETQEITVKQQEKIQENPEVRNAPPMTTSSAASSAGAKACSKKKSADAAVSPTEVTEDSEIVQPELEQKIEDLMGQMVAERQQLQTRLIDIEKRQRQLMAAKQTLAEEQTALMAAQEAEAKALVVWQEAQKTLAEARKKLDRRRLRRDFYGPQEKRLPVPGTFPEKGDDKSKGEAQPETSFTLSLPGGQLGDEPRAGDDGQCFRCGGLHGTSQCPTRGNRTTNVLTDRSGKSGKAFDKVSFVAAGGARAGREDDLRRLEASAG